MLRGNWRYIFAAVGLLTLIGLGFIGYQLYQAAEQHDPDYYYQPASHPSVLVSVPAHTPAKSYQPHCQNPQNQGDADLCAQWAAVEQVAESNRLASVNLRLGLGALVFTIIGTWLLLLTLWDTRKTSRAELRAYLSIDPDSIVGLPGAPTVQVSMRNAGGTPAYRVRFNLLGRIDDPDLAEVAIMALMQRIEPSDDNEMFVGAQKELWRELPMNFPQEGIGACREGIRWLYVLGRVDYFDVFEIKRHTWFCHVYFGPNLRGGIHRFGNRAD